MNKRPEISAQNRLCLISCADDLSLNSNLLSTANYTAVIS